VSSKLWNPGNPAVQAGFRRTASRRAEPLPTLSQAQRKPARSDTSDNSDNSNSADSTDSTDSTDNTNSAHSTDNTDNTNNTVSCRHPALANAASIITCVPFENSSGHGYEAPSRTERLNAAACSS
jgi:hypothetical protein